MHLTLFSHRIQCKSSKRNIKKNKGNYYYVVQKEQDNNKNTAYLTF